MQFWHRPSGSSKAGTQRILRRRQWPVSGQKVVRSQTERGLTARNRSPMISKFASFPIGRRQRWPFCCHVANMRRRVTAPNQAGHAQLLALLPTWTLRRISSLSKVSEVISTLWHLFRLTYTRLAENRGCEKSASSEVACHHSTSRTV